MLLKLGVNQSKHFVLKDLLIKYASKLYEYPFKVPKRKHAEALIHTE